MTTCFLLAGGLTVLYLVAGYYHHRKFYDRVERYIDNIQQHEE